MSARYLQVCTAVPSEDGAGVLARRVVEARAAAAVQVVGPVRSTYRWRGQVHTTVEWLCLAKTLESRFQELAALILAYHPYEVPEISATPISHGSEEYLGWIAEEVRGAPEAPEAAPRGPKRRAE